VEVTEQPIGDAPSSLTQRLSDDYRIIDEFDVADVLNVKIGVVRGMRRRGIGPCWFRIDGKSPRYTLAAVKRYIAELTERKNGQVASSVERITAPAMD
jgi:hypothetical protein